MTNRTVHPGGEGGAQTGASSHRLPERTRLGPVRLQVADLARSEAFYREVLGLRRVNGGSRTRSMGPADGLESLVELVGHPGARAARPGARLGLFHFALLLPDRPALADFALHARRSGTPLGMSDHRVSEALYLSDPDGLGIEVYADRPREAWRDRGGQWVMSTEPLDLYDLLSQAGPQPFRGLPAGTRMGHVHLRVADLRAGAHFYHGVLGFDQVVKDYPGALFLSAGGYHHHVGINVWASGAAAPGPEEARLLSWTLVLPSAADGDRLVAHAASLGQRPSGAGAHGGVVLHDPWGTAVEVLGEGRTLR